MFESFKLINGSVFETDKSVCHQKDEYTLRKALKPQHHTWAKPSIQKGNNCDHVNQ